MPLFAMRIKPCSAVDKWIEETSIRLQKPDFIRNPFNGFIKARDDNFLIIIEMTPRIYPEPGRIASYILCLCYGVAYFFGWWPFYIVAGLISLAFFIHSKYFFYCIAWLALYKAGHRGRPKLLTDRELLKWASKKF